MRLHKNGERIQVSLSVSPVKDATGVVIAASTMARNITRRKQAEEAMRQSQAQEQARHLEFKTLMEAVPAIVWIAHDPECHHITGNHLGHEILRIPPGANVSQTAPREECPVQFQVFREGRRVPGEEMPMQVVARSGQAIWGSELEIRFVDGTVRWIYGNVVPLLGPDKNVTGVVATFIDITALKRAEAALKQAQVELQSHADKLERIVAERTVNSARPSPNWKHFPTAYRMICARLCAPSAALTSWF